METRVNTSDRKRYGAEQLRPEIDLRVDALLEVFRSRRDLAGHLVATPGIFVRSRLSAVGLPVAEDRTLLTIPGLTVEVARECSSIRSSLMLVVTTMVLTQTLLRSAWKKALVIAIAIPLSVAKNGLRIFVLAMLATRVDRSYLTGRLHHQGGDYLLPDCVSDYLSVHWTGAPSRTEINTWGYVF